MVKDLKQSPDGDYLWMRRVQRYIAYGQKGRAGPGEKGKANTALTVYSPNGRGIMGIQVLHLSLVSLIFFALGCAGLYWPIYRSGIEQVKKTAAKCLDPYHPDGFIICTTSLDT